MSAPTHTRNLHGVAPTFFVGDVVTAAEFYDQKLGFKSLFGPRDEAAYGMREFAARDPDGHVLILAHDMYSKAT